MITTPYVDSSISDSRKWYSYSKWRTRVRELAGVRARKKAGVLVFVFLLFGLSVSCFAQDIGTVHLGDSVLQKREQATADKDQQIVKLDSIHLPNLVQIREGIYSGGLPKGNSAFDELQSRGIKTVISVDGATPDVETAKRFGLRYVHLPHGYDGVPQSCEVQLAKAILDLPGPIYIHCHHGRHRSPASTAAACVMAGLIDPIEGLEVLEVAGTGRNYIGLFDSVRQARPVLRAVLNETAAEFPEIAARAPLVETMVRIDGYYETLKEQEAAGWKGSGDITRDQPAHLALLMREEFREMHRSLDSAKSPSKYVALAEEAISLGKALEDSLRKESQSHRDDRSAALKRVGNNCKACHELFRDRPSPSK
jgi:protein tyrosine phosphatase (PTP) superfamily phosphohydrolase (DUF442 family)